MVCTSYWLHVMGIFMDKSLDKEFNIFAGPVIYCDDIINLIELTIPIFFVIIFSYGYGEGFMSAIINPKVFNAPFGRKLDDLSNLDKGHCFGGGV